MSKDSDIKQTPRQKIDNYLAQYWKDLRRHRLPRIDLNKFVDDSFQGILDNEVISLKSRILESNITAKGYARIIAILGVVYELVATGRTISQRDVYYTLKYLFKSQAECNSSIIELGQVLRLKRRFVAGKLTYKVASGPILDCSLFTGSGGLPISAFWTSCPDNDLLMECSAHYLIVIEKEGIFKHLCESAFDDKLSCIMVTGCGFPDIATRSLVARVSRRFPHIQVLGLCDYNPYGLALLLTYKVKSLGLEAHQSEPLTERDASVGERLLKLSAMQSRDMEPYVIELQCMLEGRCKYELEVVYSRGLGYFPALLEQEISGGRYF